MVNVEIPLPEGHMLVGQLLGLKVMAPDGSMYFAIRTSGLNDMELLGMSHDMATSFQDDLLKAKDVPPDF